MIKGTTAVSREVRVGVAHVTFSGLNSTQELTRLGLQAYVAFVRCAGSEWLERNMQPFVAHMLELAANPKVAATHMDAVYSRKCVSHVLRSTLGRMLGERAQLAACKELALHVAKHLAANGTFLNFCIKRLEMVSPVKTNS